MTKVTFVVCTLFVCLFCYCYLFISAGAICFMKDEKRVWEHQVDHDLFSVSKLDITVSE